MFGRVLFRRVPKIGKRTVTTGGTSVVEKASLGVFLLGGGIAALTINERRAAKQTQLREKGKNIVKDLDVDDTAADIQNLDNALVIAMGEVYADEKLEDKVFGVSHPDAIKLRRACQMYQYREKSERVKKMTAVDGKEVEETQYSYVKDWYYDQQRLEGPHPPINKNPEFPSVAPGGVNEIAPERFYFGKRKLILGNALVDQISDYGPLQLTPETCTYKGDQFTLVPTITNELYSTGRDPENPQIGDVRIDYYYVPKGVHTVVSKYLYQKNQMVAFSGVLKKKLAEEGEIKAPDAVKEVNGGEPLIIPDWLIEFAENLVLFVAPLQLCWIKRGAWTKTDAFNFIEEEDENTTRFIRFLGGAAVCAGTVAMGSAVPIVGSSAGVGAGLLVGLAIATQTIKDASGAGRIGDVELE